MNPAETIRAYYDALRAGEPLYPFFYEADSTVKFGVGERLIGYEAVENGLRQQTATTTDWTVESANLVVGGEGESAWFADDVFMAWTDTQRETHHEFDTRWSGSIHRVGDEWQFTGMHVSAPVRVGDATRDAVGDR